AKIITLEARLQVVTRQKANSPKGVQPMNWDQVQGKWKQMRGSVKEKFGKLTDDDLQMIEGNRDRFVGKLQERYGIAREEAQKRADEGARAFPAPAEPSGAPRTQSGRP